MKALARLNGSNGQYECNAWKWIQITGVCKFLTLLSVMDPKNVFTSIRPTIYVFNLRHFSKYSGH